MLYINLSLLFTIIVLTIKLTEFVYEVNEGDGSATICIMKDKTNFFSFQVSIDIMNMSANCELNINYM